MAAVAPTAASAWAIPPQALAEWLTLAALVDEIGAIPCRTSDPEAWWPDKKEVGDLSARMALDACSVCSARDACLAYALAANEREGIWGGLTPADRIDLRRHLGEGHPRPRDLTPLHGEHRAYSNGCRCEPCRRANARRIADWRARRRYAETTKSA